MVMGELLITLAKSGSKKIFEALKNFFSESQIVNEIHDEIDKNLFTVAALDEKYRYIEDVKESDIYDRFLSECINNASLNIDVDAFVEKYYLGKSSEAITYIKWFYNEITLTVWRVLRQHASRSEKILLRGQEIGNEKILSRLDQIEKSIKEKELKNTIAVTYSANMQGKQWTLNRYISSRVVDLSISNYPMQPDDVNYWKYAQKSLISEFNKRLSSFLDDGYSVDLYALAPIPLLVQLGNLFANRPNINIFQLKKVPSTFDWEDAGEKLNITTNSDLPEQEVEEVALLMSFSGKVNKHNVTATVGEKIPQIEMFIKEPFDDFLRCKSQLDDFLFEYRKVKSSLGSKGVKRIHLFASIPIAFAIGIGQAYNTNYDPEIITYDFNQGVYTKALTIGEK